MLLAKAEDMNFHPGTRIAERTDSHQLSSDQPPCVCVMWSTHICTCTLDKYDFNVFKETQGLLLHSDFKACLPIHNPVSKKKKKKKKNPDYHPSCHWSKVTSSLTCGIAAAQRCPPPHLCVPPCSAKGPSPHPCLKSRMLSYPFSPGSFPKPLPPPGGSSSSLILSQFTHIHLPQEVLSVPAQRNLVCASLSAPGLILKSHLLKE
jgi:hypothetical protein